jgi:hypothetical protein
MLIILFFTVDCTQNLALVNAFASRKKASGNRHSIKSAGHTKIPSLIKGIHFV